jgi:hypothetical protein
VLDPRVRRFHQRCKRSVAKIFDTIDMTFESSIKIYEFAIMIFDTIDMTFESSIKIFEFAIMVF